MWKTKLPSRVKTPGGRIFPLFEQMATGNHLFIGGATGSGKSVLINGIIQTVLTIHGPGQAQFILIDPKKVELSEYRNIPHCLAYGNTTATMTEALKLANHIMEDRFSEMEKHREKNWNGSRIYVVIDELADLLTIPERKKECLPMIQRLLQTGRAAGITVIAASQTAIATVITTAIKCNFSSRVALRTASAQDSRNIIAQAGAEHFPDPQATNTAFCLWMNGANLKKYVVPVYTREEHFRIIHHWSHLSCYKA